MARLDFRYLGLVILLFISYIFLMNSQTNSTNLRAFYDCRIQSIMSKAELNELQVEIVNGILKKLSHNNDTLTMPEDLTREKRSDMYPAGDGLFADEANSDNSQKAELTETRKNRSKCRIVDYDDSFEGDFHCVRLPTDGRPHVCVYKKAADDKWVSGAIHKGQLWEPDNVRIFQKLLKKDSALGVVDIGANFGQYSVIAAALGHQVVAVEALGTHVNMLHRAVLLNGFQNNITIVHNAVSDSYRMVELATHTGNMGSTHIAEKQAAGTFTSGTNVPTILLDDVLEAVPFTRALMKIDIEGHEPRALSHSERLFSRVYFPYILMEWSGSRMAVAPADIKRVQDLVDSMVRRGYRPIDPKGNLVSAPTLNLTDWKKWPFDVLWKHALVT